MRKKARLLLLLLALVVALPACGGSNAPAATTTQAAATTTAKAAETTTAKAAETTTAKAAETTTAKAAETTTKAAATTTAATTTKAAETTAAAPSGPDISEFKKLKIMLVSSTTTPDYDSVMLPVMNERLKKDINASLEVEFIGWGDYAQKIPLVLASGEAFDGINASTWTRFYEEAAKGAYYDITNLAPIYMPKTYAEWDDNMISQITVGGKIVGLPTFYASYNVMSYIIRGDIADEVGFDKEIKNMDDFGDFMRLVAQKRPDIWTGDWTANSDDLLGYHARDNGYLLWPGPQIVMDAREGVPISVYMLPGTLDFFKKMKAWSDEGLWSKQVLADTSTGNFNEGRAASRLHNLDTWRSAYVAHPEWDPRVYRVAPYTMRTRAMQDGIAIPASSKNPERALMMFELWFQNKDYWELLAYGVRGTHWEENADGTLNMLVPAEVWSPGGYNDWCFQRNEWIYPMKTWPPNYYEKVEDCKSVGIINPYALFNTNFEPITNERAALLDVHTQYAKPLVYGYIDDVEAGYQTLLDKANEAGLQKVLDEINSQLEAFKASR